MNTRREAIEALDAWIALLTADHSRRIDRYIKRVPAESEKWEEAGPGSSIGAVTHALTRLTEARLWLAHSLVADSTDA